MANKNVAVNLTFTANTQQAKQQLQSLQSTLSSLTAGSSLGAQITADLQQGINAAAQLKVALTNATNVNTGKLDLGKFNQQLKQSNMSIKQYAQSLASLGPQGSQAFLQLARAMQNAENPMMRLSAGVRQLGTTLMNTARWQISSSILMGFTSAVSGAVSYAKELNASLNNIRIVTGKSVEEMEVFAEKANQAAKALSTTTTAYTDAALIYYQQGLDGKAVLDRANTTVKLANVVGKSAQEVSEWTTAIWNNFYDGTESLESYADSLVALGASTASSADEIAQGLEKFAAVGDTVGLSFDYAAAALATVTAQTRQSADVVGTAFKTLFARMQDLKLGKTLDDGTTLGQYSEAMFKVGVNIKTASGELKDMDVILDELGARWQTLDKDQQVALAKSVAGLRQYNQFIALMSNYDTFKMNVETSETSEGELEKQAQVYAESWEGAAQRVKAAAESVYSDIIDDDFFIDIMNFFAGLLETVDKFIDTAGGLPVLLSSIGAILMQRFSGKIASGIESIVLAFQSLTVSGRQAAETLRTTAMTEAKTAAINTGTTSGTVSAEVIEREITLQETLNNKAKELTGFQTQVYQARIEGVKALDEENLKLAEQLELIEKRNAEMADNLIYGENSGPFAKELVEQAKTSAENVATIDIERETLRTAGTTAQDGQVAVADIMTSTAVAGSQGVIQADQVDTLIQGGQENFDANFTSLVEGAGLAETEVKELRTTLMDLMSIYEELGSKDPGATFEDMGDRIDTATGQAKKFAKSGLKKSITSAAKATGKSTKTLETYTDGIQDATKKTDGLNKGLKKTKKMQEDLDKDMRGAKGPKSFASSFVNIAGAMSSVAMGFTMVGNTISTIGDLIDKGKASFTDILGIITSLGMAIPMIISGFSKLNSTLQISAVVSGLFAASKQAENIELTKQNGLIAANMLAKMAGITVDEAATVITEALALGEEKLTVANILEAASNNGLTISKGAATIATIAQTVANWRLLASMPPLLAISLVFLAALAALALVVIGLVAGIKALSDAYNADAIAAEQAAKHAEETAAAYERVKEKFEELKASLEDYNKAQNAIAALKEGTEEWRQAIQDSNAQVLELLDKYPELAKYVENINGRLVISDANQLKMYNEAQEEVALMNNINTQAQLDADKAWQKSQKTNVVRAIDEADVDEDDIRKGMDLLAEKYADSNAIFEADEYAAFVEDLKAIDEDLVDVFNDNKEAIQDLIVAEENLASREALVAQSKVDNLLYSQENFNAAHYGKNVQAKARKAYTDAENKAKAANKTDDWHNAFIWHYSTDEGEKAFAEYAKLMGYEDADATDFQKDKIVFEYKGEDGDTVEDVEVTYEQMQQALIDKAVAKEAAKITAKVNQMTSTITNLSASKSTSDQALATFLEEGDLSYLDPAMASKLTDSSLTDEEAQAFGYSSAEKAMEAFNKALEDYDPQEARSNILVRKAQEIDSTLTAGAETLGVSKEALEMYAASLVDANSALEGNEEQAAKMAVQHFKLAKGVNGLQETFKKYSQVLKQGKKNSLDYYEALGALKQQVEETFGLKVSADFMNESNLADLEAMANGDEQALQRLQQALVSDYVLHLNIDESYKTALDSAMTDLMQRAAGADLHTELTLDNSNAIDAINTALRTGAASIEDIEAMFNNANLAMPEYKLAKVPHTSTSHMDTTSEVNILGAKIPITTKGTTTTTTYTEVPYFGDNPPTFDDKGNLTDAGGGGSLTFTTLGNASVSQDILDYEGDGKTNSDASDNKKTIENLKDEKDRYRDINEELEDIERNLDAISKKKERAFGKDKLKYIQQEKALLDEQIEGQKRYIGLIEKAKEDQYKKIEGYGFAFDDETGRIVNYDTVYDQMLARYQAGINSTDKDSDARKAWDEWWETFISDTDKYADTLDLLESETTKLDDQIQERLEKDYEDLEYQIELKTIVNDSGLKKIEFALGRIEDDAYAAAEAIGLLGEQAEFNMANFKANDQGIRDLLTLKQATPEQIEAFMNGDGTALFGLDLNQQDFELLQQYQDNMISSYESIEEAFNSIFEKMDEVFATINEEFNELTSVLEHTSNVLETYQNIIELAGASTLGISNAMQLDIIDAQLDVAQTTITNAKAQYDKNKEMLAEARDGLAKATTEAEKKKWQESIETYEEQLRESEQAWLDALANGQELTNQRREKAIDIAIKEFLKETTGYESMDELQRIYDQQKQLRDLYVSDYEKVYSLSKISRQLEKSINDTSNIQAKKQLLALEEKINKAKEVGVKISSYELENLEREYQIELAKIALQEAQNAKSSVRLVRNAEGGMMYLYTADRTALDEAQQKYEDAVYNSQKANEEWLNSAEEGLLQATATYIEQLAIINNATYDSEEERNEAIAALNEWYLSQQKFYTGQIDLVLQNNSELYHGHIETMKNYYDENNANFYNMTNDLIGSSDRFIFHFQDTLLAQLHDGLIGDSNSAEAWYTALVKSVGGINGNNPPESLMGKLKAAQNDWYSNTQTNFKNGGIRVDEFRTAVAAYLGYGGTTDSPGVQKVLEDVTGAIKTLTQQTNFTEAKNAATTYGKEVAEKMKDAAKQIGSVNTALQTLITKWGGKNGVADLPNIHKTITVTTFFKKVEAPGDGGSPGSDNDPGKTQSPYKGMAYTTFSSDYNAQAYGTYTDDMYTPLTIFTPSGGKEVFVVGYTYHPSYKEYGIVIEGILSNSEAGLPGFGYTKYRMMVNQNVAKDYFGITYDKKKPIPGLAEVPFSSLGQTTIKKTDSGAQWFSFDTGGYTGEWGPEGRLAVLHQKEIILNARDTENLLSTVSMVRELATQLDLNALTMAHGLSNFMINTMATAPQTLNQNVAITAEFPHVTDREEIKEAFGDLINLAAQYASRK